MKQNSPKYGSDLVVEMLKSYEIEYAALNPGATVRGIQDSIVNYGKNTKPELIECCHEEIAVAIAHGYAKAKGRPMVVVVHNIVGLLHASMAIFNACVTMRQQLLSEERGHWIPLRGDHGLTGFTQP